MKPKLPPTWRVELAEHDVERWHVATCSIELPAVSAGDAAWRVIRWAHADAGVPPWRPYVRLSMVHATVTADEVEPAPAPLELPRAA